MHLLSLCMCMKNIPMYISTSVYTKITVVILDCLEFLLLRKFDTCYLIYSYACNLNNNNNNYNNNNAKQDLESVVICTSDALSKCYEPRPSDVCSLFLSSLTY